MEQRDYLKKQIDLLGRILGKLLASLLEFKTKGDVNEGVEIVSQSLKEELGLNLEDILAMPKDELIEKMHEKRNLTSNDLSELAKLFSFILEEQKELKDYRLYEKSLEILEYLQKTDVNYSYERHLEIDRVKKILARNL